MADLDYTPAIKTLEAVIPLAEPANSAIYEHTRNIQTKNTPTGEDHAKAIAEAGYPALINPNRPPAKIVNAVVNLKKKPPNATTALTLLTEAGAVLRLQHTLMLNLEALIVSATGASSNADIEILGSEPNPDKVESTAADLAKLHTAVHKAIDEINKAKPLVVEKEAKEAEAAADTKNNIGELQAIRTGVQEVIGTLTPLSADLLNSLETAVREIGDGITIISTPPIAVDAAVNSLGRARDKIKGAVDTLAAITDSVPINDARTKLKSLNERLQSVINAIRKGVDVKNEDSQKDTTKPLVLDENVTEGNVDLPSETWGVKFTQVSTTPGVKDIIDRNANINDEATGNIRFPGMGPVRPTVRKEFTRTTTSVWYLTLLPAMKSNIPLQGGMDTPAAMPGLNFKIVSSVIKHKIVGFRPVYQHLGVDTINCTMVGCFTGADGAAPKSFTTNAGLTHRNTYTTNSLALDPFRAEGGVIDVWSSDMGAIAAKYDSFRDFQSFYQFAVQSGAELEVEINVARNTKIKNTKGEDGPFRDGTNGNPKFKGFVKRIETFYARTDRTWYVIDFEITDSNAKQECVNLTGDIEEQIKKINPDAVGVTPEGNPEELTKQAYVDCLADANTSSEIETTDSTEETKKYFYYSKLTGEGWYQTRSTKVTGMKTENNPSLLTPNQVARKLLDLEGIKLGFTPRKQAKGAESLKAYISTTGVKLNKSAERPVLDKDSDISQYTQDKYHTAVGSFDDTEDLYLLSNGESFARGRGDITSIRYLSPQETYSVLTEFDKFLQYDGLNKWLSRVDIASANPSACAKSGATNTEALSGLNKTLNQANQGAQSIDKVINNVLNSDVVGALNRSLNNTATGINKAVNSTLNNNLANSINKWLNDSANAINDSANNLVNSISPGLSDSLNNTANDINTSLNNTVNDINTSLNNTINSLSGVSTPTTNVIQDTLSKLVPKGSGNYQVKVISNKGNKTIVEQTYDLNGIKYIQKAEYTTDEKGQVTNSKALTEAKPV